MKKNYLFLFIMSLFFVACNNVDEMEQDTSSLPQQNEKVRLFAIKYLDATEITTKAASVNARKWTPGQTIRIKFLNGSSKQQEFVKTTAKTWLQYANLKFEYVTTSADVKIGFDWNGDNITWSHVGTECQSIDQNAVSLNFGYFDEDMLGYDETKAAVLQEFGHILGLTYEHQSPAAGVKWKKPMVMKWFRQIGWTEKQVNEFFYIQFNSIQSNYTSFDPLSIMVYPLHSSLTEDGYGTNINTTLSATDISFIKTMYPGATQVGYYNGYEHDLPEPNWEKLKTINGMIGATRDLAGNYYYYPYSSGSVVKYDPSLVNRTTLGTVYPDYHRIAASIVPTDKGDLLLRKGEFGGNASYMNTNGTLAQEQQISSVQNAYSGSIAYDYDRDLLYVKRDILDNKFNKLGSFVPLNTDTYQGILYWGKKYKWAVHMSGLSDAIFYVYQQSNKSDLYSKANLVATIPVPGFSVSNGAYPMVYEYNDKLVVLRYCGSSTPGYGSILILDPTGKISSTKYKEYTYANAKWKQSSSSHYLCGGFQWRNKLMVYDEAYNKYYFEMPELLVK